MNYHFIGDNTGFYKKEAILFKPFCTFDNHDFRLKLITWPFEIAVIMEHTENIPLIKRSHVQTISSTSYLH
jgi:hypothetical protein